MPYFEGSQRVRILFPSIIHELLSSVTGKSYFLIYCRVMTSSRTFESPYVSSTNRYGVFSSMGPCAS